MVYPKLLLFVIPELLILRYRVQQLFLLQRLNLESLLEYLSLQILIHLVNLVCPLFQNIQIPQSFLSLLNLSLRCIKIYNEFIIGWIKRDFFLGVFSDIVKYDERLLILSLWAFLALPIQYTLLVQYRI